MNKKAKSQEWARERIRSAGLRATPARIATLKLLQNSESPLTHAEVSDALHNLEIDKATIFRNLNDLVSKKVLRRSTLGDNVWRFEVIQDTHEHDSHPHFICIDCGAVTCMEGVVLKQKTSLANPLLKQVTEILLRGQCGECA
jgi:Fur family ferric uptake transcriptional regulator